MVPIAACESANRVVAAADLVCFVGTSAAMCAVGFVFVQPVAGVVVLTAGLLIPGATFDAVRDADGSAFVIHAKADDERTDPSGNSGDRIAYAVL